MHYGQQANQAEFKGIYYNESKEQKYYEGGAHFKYKDLYTILDRLKGYRLDSNDKKVLSQRNDSNSKEKTENNLKQAKTRNNNGAIDKSNTKKPTTCRNANQKNSFLNQCIQSKYLGLSLYINQNAKHQPTFSKYKQIPKGVGIEVSNRNYNKVVSNPPKPQIGSKRMQSEEAHSNAFAKTDIQTARQNGKETGSSTQRVAECKEQAKSIGKGGQSRNNHPIANANPNTYVFGNNQKTSRANKSRNCNQMQGSGLFDSLSFQTKRSWRSKDQKDLSSKNTIDKIGMLNKKISIRKVGGDGKGGGSISITNRIQKTSMDKQQKIAFLANKIIHQKTNSNVGSHCKSIKRGFLSSFDK